YETAAAVLPAFLQLLGAPTYVQGLVEGAADAAASFLRLAAGWITDRLERLKPLVMLGYTLTVTATGMLAPAAVWPAVLLLRVLAWTGKGLRSPPRNVLLTSSVPEEHRGKAFGFHRAGDTVGAIVGPLVAAALLGWLASENGTDIAHYRAVLAWTLLPGLAGGLAFTLLVREVARPRREARPFWGSLGLLPSDYRWFLAGVGIFGMGDFSVALMILAVLQTLTPSLGFDQAAMWGAVLLALRNVMAAAMAFPLGALG